MFNRKSIIWGSLVICLLLSICAVYVQKEPKTYQETVNASTYLLTEPLQQGDSVEQTFRSTRKGLSAVECAVSYDDKKAEQGKVLFEVFDAEQELIVEQELSLIACPNQGFLKITLPKPVMQEQTFSIRITNTSTDDTVFSALYTVSPYRLLENLENYNLNAQKQQGQLISRYTYLSGYNVYPAITWVIWIMLAWVVLAGWIQKK